MTSDSNVIFFTHRPQVASLHIYHDFFHREFRGLGEVFSKKHGGESDSRKTNTR